MPLDDHYPPSIGERYSNAAGSSNLKIDRGRRDVDYVIASGLAGDSLSSLLLRLHAEYDAVRAPHRQAMARAESGETSHAESVTAHALILMQLRTLRSAKDAWAEFAQVEAIKQKVTDRKAVAAVAGRVLEVALRPTCHHCDGRGFDGGAHRGDKQIVCRPCKGSGHRRDGIGKNDSERSFANHLQMRMSELLHRGQAAMRAGLAAVKEAKALISRAEC